LDEHKKRYRLQTSILIDEIFKRCVAEPLREMMINFKKFQSEPWQGSGSLSYPLISRPYFASHGEL